MNNEEKQLLKWHKKTKQKYFSCFDLPSVEYFCTPNTTVHTMYWNVLYRGFKDTSILLLLMHRCLRFKMTRSEYFAWLKIAQVAGQKWRKNEYNFWGSCLGLFINDVMQVGARGHFKHRWLDGKMFVFQKK